MKYLLHLFPVLLILSSCAGSQEATVQDQTAVADSLIDSWHRAAAVADTLTYFGLMDSSSVFIGTDPSERWELPEFKAYVMPFFREGRGWDFKARERHFRTMGRDCVIVFDELLDTWMGPCFGSGVLQRHGNDWKIVHYHLAFTVPNEDIREVIKILEEKESGD